MKVSGARFGGRDIESMRLNGAFVLKRKEDTPNLKSALNEIRSHDAFHLKRQKKKHS